MSSSQPSTALTDAAHAAPATDGTIRTPWSTSAAIGVATLATALAAQVSFTLPYTPVPLTLQPIVVLLGGAALGARAGAASQMAYLAIGVAGAPVFAWAPDLLPGLGRLLGPTGGYLLSYPAAAALVGWLVARGWGRSAIKAACALGAGMATVYAGGILGLLAYAPSGDAWLTAARLGVLPFAGADLVKIALAAPLVSRVLRAR